LGLFLYTVQWIIGVLLVIIVLLQAGRAGSLASVFGGGGGPETIFGVRAGDILTRATAILMALFMINCLLLTVVPLKSHVSTVVDRVKVEQPATAPQTSK